MRGRIFGSICMSRGAKPFGGSSGSVEFSAMIHPRNIKPGGREEERECLRVFAGEPASELPRKRDSVLKYGKTARVDCSG